MVSKNNRILIYRKGAIGDVVQTLPLIKLLRKNNPNSRIDYLTGSQALVDLLKNATDYIDNTYLITKNFAELDIKNYPIDQFIFLHSGWHKAYWLNFRHFHAKKVFIYKRDDSLSAVTNYVTSYYPELKSQLQKDPFFILEWQNLNYSLPVVAEHCEAKTGADKSYICIVPGVGNLRPHRAYPLEKWLDFINQILERTDFNIKLLGGPDEINLLKELDSHLAKFSSDKSNRLENLIGRTSLLDLVSILKNAQHLYSADTGILHIGAATGVPITSIFAITSEKRFGPFSPNTGILRNDKCSCSLSLTNRPKHCSNPINGYAQCLWQLNFNAIEN